MLYRNLLIVKRKFEYKSNRTRSLFDHDCLYRKVKVNQRIVDLIVHNNSTVVVDASIRSVMVIEYFYFSESDLFSGNAIILYGQCT